MNRTAIDAWMQHPTPRFLAEPFFDSLRRWLGDTALREIPLRSTLESTDEGGVGSGCFPPGGARRAL